MSAFDRKAAREQFCQQLRAEHKSITQWARERGFCPTTVDAVLSGRAMGYCGMGRSVMRVLGWPLPPAMPPRRPRHKPDIIKRLGKPHLRLHADGRIDYLGRRQAASA